MKHFFGNFKPKLKTTEIVVQNAAKELLVYNLQTNRAYCLNEISAKIYEHCDGTKNATEICKILNLEIEYIFLAVDLLERENLLDAESRRFFSEYSGLDRRRMLKSALMSSAVALPLIISVLSPPSVNAASNTTLTDCNGQPIPISDPPCRPTNCVVTCQGNDFDIVIINGCRYCSCKCP